MLPFLWSILDPIINLITFYEGLNNKKHVQILESLQRLCQQVFCVWQRTLITLWNDPKFVRVQFHEHQNIITNYG
jgi:hypothetical protein